jgi:hypothetical protein
MNNNWSWKIPSLLQALVSIFQVIFVYFLPESPRWLVANGRSAEATKVLSKHHSGTEEPTELVRLQMAEITSAINFERSLESVSYLQFFRTSKFCADALHAPTLGVSAMLTFCLTHRGKPSSSDCCRLSRFYHPVVR